MHHSWMSKAAKPSDLASWIKFAAMWAEEKPELPDNYPLAFKRWRITDRACEKDPELGKEVAKVFEDSLKRNFCRLMTANEVKRRTNITNYLCYFPMGKMTSNGAAEYQGTSINKNLLKGPNYLVSLVGVLLRFRQKRRHREDVPSGTASA